MKKKNEAKKNAVNTDVAKSDNTESATKRPDQPVEEAETIANQPESMAAWMKSMAAWMESTVAWMVDATARTENLLSRMENAAARIEWVLAKPLEPGESDDQEAVEAIGDEKTKKYKIGDDTFLYATADGRWIYESFHHDRLQIHKHPITIEFISQEKAAIIFYFADGKESLPASLSDFKDKVADREWQRNTFVPPKPRPKPKWDRETGTLSYEGKTILSPKKNRKAQKNGFYVGVLDAFEKRGWPDRVKYPYGEHSDKQRINAINYLNDAIREFASAEFWSELEVEPNLILMQRNESFGPPDSAKNMIVMGIDSDDLLHIQIFDEAGKRVADTNSKQSTRRKTIQALKNKLAELPPSRELAEADKAWLIEQTKLIVDLAPFKFGLKDSFVTISYPEVEQDSVKN